MVEWRGFQYRRTFQSLRYVARVGENGFCLRDQVAVGLLNCMPDLKLHLGSRRDRLKDDPKAHTLSDAGVKSREPCLGEKSNMLGTSTLRPRSTGVPATSEMSMSRQANM